MQVVIDMTTHTYIFKKQTRKKSISLFLTKHSGLYISLAKWLGHSRKVSSATGQNRGIQPSFVLPCLISCPSWKWSKRSVILFSVSTSLHLYCNSFEFHFSAFTSCMSSSIFIVWKWISCHSSSANSVRNRIVYIHTYIHTYVYENFPSIFRDSEGTHDAISFNQNSRLYIAFCFLNTYYFLFCPLSQPFCSDTEENSGLKPRPDCVTQWPRNGKREKGVLASVLNSRKPREEMASGLQKGKSYSRTGEEKGEFKTGDHHGWA